MINIPALHFLRKPKSEPKSTTTDYIPVGYMKLRCPVCGFIQTLKLAAARNTKEVDTVLIDKDAVETFYNQRIITLAENHNCTATRPKTLIKMDITSIELTDACIITIPDLL